MPTIMGMRQVEARASKQFGLLRGDSRGLVGWGMVSSVDRTKVGVN